jgi:hypothetical protein
MTLSPSNSLQTCHLEQLKQIFGNGLVNYPVGKSELCRSLHFWGKEVSEFIRWCAIRLDSVAVAPGQYSILIPLMLIETGCIVFVSKINLDNSSMKLSINIGDMKEQMVARIRV